VRFGLVALAAGLFTVDLIISTPMPASLSSWYVAATAFVFLSVLGFAVWGFYTSLGGRRLWSGNAIRLTLQLAPLHGRLDVLGLPEGEGHDRGVGLLDPLELNRLPSDTNRLGTSKVRPQASQTPSSARWAMRQVPMLWVAGGGGPKSTSLLPRPA
jgi:hypothetical protein